MNSPLSSARLFHLGHVPIAQAVVTTWVIIALLEGAACLVTDACR